MIEKLVVYPTFNCNMKCRYCFYKKNTNQYISFTRFKNAFKKFLKISQNPSIIFLGGEPLLNKDSIIKLIKEIRKNRKELPITVFTNGINIDKKIIDFFKKNKINIIISIDGSKKINDNEKKYYPSHFDTVMHNIKKYKLTKEATINMVVRKNNFRKLPQNIIHLYNLGFRKIGWNIDYLDNWEKNDIKELEKSIKNILMRYLKMLKDNKDIYEISNRYEIIDFLTENKTNKCRNIILYPDGKFYLCDKVRNYKFILKGNISKKREYLFKKLSKTYPQKGLFCPFGIYLYLKYEKKLPSKIIKEKLDIIYAMMNMIEKNTIKYFKIFLKFKYFRAKHNI